MKAAPDPEVQERDSADRAEQDVVQHIMDANGDGHIDLTDADDRLIEQLIAQKCPTASKENIDHIRDIIKKRVEIAKQQGGGLMIVDEHAQSLSERGKEPPKEQDRGPRGRGGRE